MPAQPVTLNVISYWFSTFTIQYYPVFLRLVIETQEPFRWKHDSHAYPADLRILESPPRTDNAGIFVGKERLVR